MKRNAIFVFCTCLILQATYAGENTPLLEALINGDNVKASSLIKGGADVNVRGKGGVTPLISAALANNHEVAALLIKHGADIDAKGKNLNTPLILAAWVGAREVTALLINHGANIEAKNGHGKTALMVVVTDASKSADLLQEHGFSIEGRGNVAPLLIEAGANIHASDQKSGFTPLHFAAESNDVKNVGLLLKAGAYLEATGNVGNTPLHIAALYNALDAARLLVLAGANPRAQNQYGQTPLFLARVKKNWGIVKLLETVQ